MANALLGMYLGIANGLFIRQNESEHRRGTLSLTEAIERVVATLEAAGPDCHPSSEFRGGAKKFSAAPGRRTMAILKSFLSAATMFLSNGAFSRESRRPLTDEL